jgi:serine protease Do
MRPTTAELASRSPRDGGTSCHATLAATNKFLAPINKSQTGVKATKKRIRQKKRCPPHAALPQLIGDAPMSTLKKLLSTAAVLVALVGPAQAERVEVVNGWEIEYWSDVFAGACTATGNYPAPAPKAAPSKTRLQFVRIYNDNNNNALEWGIILRNSGWKTKDKNFEVVIEIYAKDKPKRTWTKSFAGLDDGGLVVSGLSVEEMNFFAYDAEASVRFLNKKDGNVIAYLNITNSATQIRAVVNCLKAHAPSVAKQDPTTPKQQDTPSAKFGTAFFVAPKYLLSNYHVVENCTGQIYIKYPTYRAEKAYISSYDKKADLVLLKTEMKHFAVAQFRLRARLGEQVASYGFPYGDVLSSSGNFTLGTVSALSGINDDSSNIQFSTPIQPGNSGGPLMDSSGVVIGVSHAIFIKPVGGTMPQNVNFGISAGTAINFLGTRNIDAEIASLVPKLEPEKIAEAAMQFTVQVSCDVK